MDRIFTIVKIKLTSVVPLSLPWDYIHIYDHNRITGLVVYIADLR